jgi:TonB family protein
METVTNVLVGRMQRPDGMSRMAAVSVAAHVVLGLVLLVVMPSLSSVQREPETIMQISLGDAPGPRNGGMTSMSRRPVQAPPQPEPIRRMPVTPPAAKAPEMAIPTPKARPVPPKPVVREAPPEAKAQTPPARGEEPRPGNAMAETGARGAGFAGLTTGGGGTSGYLDVGNFCCPEYLTTMLQLIQRNWNSKQSVDGQTQVRFTVQRDGRITDVAVEQPSGYFALDQTAQRALLLTRQLPPLPSQFTEPQLTVHLVFRYQR